MYWNGEIVFFTTIKIPEVGRWKGHVIDIGIFTVHLKFEHTTKTSNPNEIEACTILRLELPF